MAAGKTRTCPHCKATILESMAVCPGCQHHLRFDPNVMERMVPAGTPLKVEGSIRHPPEGGAWEYSIMLTVRDEKGNELSRQVVGVGALQPTEQRSFSLTVELFAPRPVARTASRPAEDPHTATGTGFASLFRGPRARSQSPETPAAASGAAEARPAGPGGPPPLPKDPRPPAPQSQVRVFPAGSPSPKVAPPKPPGK